MRLSPYNPLDFGTERFTDRANIESDHIQTWEQSDVIWLEVVHDSLLQAIPHIVVRLDGSLNGVSRSEDSTNIAIYNGKYCSVWRITLSNQSTTSLHQVTVSETINGTTETKTSNYFRVLADNDAELQNTMLITYTNKDNSIFRNHVWVNPYQSPPLQYTISLRVEGGFKDSGRQFAVDSEQFVTTRRNTLDIYSLDYTIRQVTLGLGEGVPVWYADMLNRILSLSNVYIDGVRFVRNESDTPEITPIQDGVKSFIVTQNLRDVEE